MNTPYPELARVIDPAALADWNAAIERARDEYAERPFIDGRMGPSQENRNAS